MNRISSSARRLSLFTLLVAVALPLAASARAQAQAPGYTRGDWNRVETEHFLFLYPDEMEEWTLDVAARMEAVHEAVGELVGHTPEDRVTVLVDDPGNVSNGSMNPGPLLYLWPTPPDPRSMIGENRGWGEILAVHEFAHAAHLTRPSRNPTRRFLASLIPLPMNAIMLSTPRWAIEGYATYVEGRLTGSGRPHGVWRPAVLRTWALEGGLPHYGQVSGASGFYGGAMAYLVGSAYLEWLVAREGGDESVLPDVWRRLTARETRSFGGAFSGVFGAPPDELYGLFTVDVTERALAVRDAVEAAGGVVEGELFQRLSWYVGDPAVSPDGERLAVRLTSRDGPSRLVVMSTTPDTMSTRERERYEEIFEKDPEDVEPVRRRPRPQEPLATLHPTLGRAFTRPAWMPDGRGILVVRSDVVGNGLSRPDLFLWSWDDGGVRRITRGAAIREASPAPDGSWAAGLRCLHGLCDVVRIGLDDGAVTPLTDADPLSPYTRPRVSPDGRTIIAGRQVDGEWRLVAMDADGSSERRIGPDDGAARFDASFLADGRILLTSTRGGIHDIEILDPATDSVLPVTRALGAAVAPTTDTDGDIFFLSLHSRGWDLRRIARDAGPAAPVVYTDTAAFPSATIPLADADTFPARPIGPVRPYGLGPRSRTILPMIHLAEDGYGGGFGLTGTDPIGRLSWQIQGMYGDERAPVGGSLRARYRGFRPWLHLEGFWSGEAFDSPLEPEVPGPDPDPATDPPGAVFPDLWGGFGALELRGSSLHLTHGIRAGGSIGRVGPADLTRSLGFAEVDARLRQGPGHWWLEESLALHGAAGRTGDLDWTRWLGSASLALRGQDRGIGVTGTLGSTDAPAGSLEAFTLGGGPIMLHDPAVLSQQLPMPALRGGTLRGAEIRTLMAELYGEIPFTSFFWMGDAEGDGRDWYRLVGTRLDQETPPIPYLRLPAGHFTLGIARTLDEPDEGEWRAWLTMGFSP